MWGASILGLGRGLDLTANRKNMYWESGWSRKISESPITTRAPRGGEGIVYLFSIPDLTWPQTALQPSTPSKAEPGQAGPGQAERSRAELDLSGAKPIGVGLSLSRTEPSRTEPDQAKMKKDRIIPPHVAQRVK